MVTKVAMTHIPPKFVYKYVEMRVHKTAAHREIEVLSHAFTKAVEWGLIDRHPFKGEVRLEGEEPRNRYVEDWEITECLNLPNKGKGDGVAIVQDYVRLKLLTSLSRGDSLRLEPARQFKDDGIHVQRHKIAKNGLANYLHMDASSYGRWLKMRLL